MSRYVTTMSIPRLRPTYFTAIEARVILCSPMGKTTTRGRRTMPLTSKNILIDRQNWSRYLTATRMEHLSTGCTKRLLNGKEDTNSIPSTVYAGYSRLP